MNGQNRRNKCYKQDKSVLKCFIYTYSNEFVKFGKVLKISNFYGLVR